MHPITIIGTGLAGYTVARELRKLDPNCPLRLITADEGHFYSKPMLSNAFSQHKTPEMLITTPVEQMAEQLQAEILTHTLVTQLEPQWHRLKINEKSLTYSQLVLACGAKPIVTPCTGTVTEKILFVNSLSEYRYLRTALQKAKHVTIIGAGLIGCEFANDLQEGGFSVTIISNATYPLNRLVPTSVGQLLQQVLQERGVTWLLGKTVKHIAPIASARYQLTLVDNQTVATDIVISAIGLRPQVKLATAAGLTVKEGIVVNRYLQTNMPDVYALGDCAQIEGLVLLYVMPLMNAARALAKTLVGQTTAVTYPAMPIVVKTPACPIVISPPPKTVDGQWHIETQGQDIRGLFYITNTQQLAGFVLTGKMITEKMTWLKQLPPLLKAHCH
ncbi:nitric oxide reductase [Thioploca ingrica]|uniref:Nitric oxide reductase n=1 Tax=Thioploca ingrica TaxID=40754 RepID=A0A090APK0_9GAMM|nr:nitric oxide reductase [Thioploca ingrica]